MNNAFSQAMDFRHACKIFDADKKISDDAMEYILEAGRKSPSSFGMEAWKFVVITNEELKAKLRPFCWDQVQITSCSHLVVILAGIDSVKVQSGEVEKRFKRRQMPQESLDFYMDIYAKHLEKTLSSNENIYAWTAKQSYIALGNMMTAAAYIGIDSCPIEGFEKEKVETVLGLDTSKYQVAALVPFGYRINEQPTQLRLPFEQVVEFIK
ncbi:MAG TPA: NAD(P)H-dependent oxidoreductase [Sulfurovum sp.]|jgi:nitroreductase|nr:MAG: NAD(P)H-dependent oxidoreductase [Sulfurovum sp. 35-42-20]OYZ26586.1 MAG: NAD(P)H-dependent oxidoreductase [Sulfurovum sp. 16-42-52]OYZ50673.1 MAG: NAD(P)H-dependent oxidoreductase [Sulfurovum sp. 24-42-9]OZA47131.1 MAG: NAD(P)H-dependent oxidoreductase [Sulfurovum sp. 17-42-90]OZA60774.1 MAG: NAD(P)H-dependent oxidoreductase [Sulfurovum sp. 39-42-12]HQR74566.1 NAD(P)H-dependent oxidoreductase [Sulfurovum sp.]